MDLQVIGALQGLGRESEGLQLKGNPELLEQSIDADGAAAGRVIQLDHISSFLL
jgi:hypothetical protein